MSASETLATLGTIQGFSGLRTRVNSFSAWATRWGWQRLTLTHYLVLHTRTKNLIGSESKGSLLGEWEQKSWVKSP